MTISLILKKYPYLKTILIVLAIFIILPSIIVVADELGGYMSEQLIGRNGVADSNLLIGREGVNNSFLDIGLSIISPTSPQGSMISLWEFLFVACALFLLVKQAFGKISITQIIVSAILIYVTFALLPGIHAAIEALFGG